MNGDQKMNLIFDLVVPREYSQETTDQILHQVMGLMKEVDHRYECVITMDKSYIAEE